MSRHADTVVKVFLESPHGPGGQKVHVFEMPGLFAKGGRNPHRILQTFEHGSPPKRKRIAIPGWPYKDRPAPNSYSQHASYYARERDMDDFIATTDRDATRSGAKGFPRYDYRLMDVVTHDGLDAFFEHIGWDYKSRTYRGEPRPKRGEGQ